jgi:hypothetical protein
MGRKTRNNLSIQEDDKSDLKKKNITSENVEENDIHELIIKDEKKEQQQRIEEDDILYDIKSKIIEYTEVTAIPLCSYLNVDLLEEFMYTIST